MQYYYLKKNCSSEYPKHFFSYNYNHTSLYASREMRESCDSANHASCIVLDRIFASRASGVRWFSLTSTWQECGGYAWTRSACASTWTFSGKNPVGTATARSFAVDRNGLELFSNWNHSINYIRLELFRAVPDRKRLTERVLNLYKHGRQTSENDSWPGIS